MTVISVAPRLIDPVFRTLPTSRPLEARPNYTNIRPARVHSLLLTETARSAMMTDISIQNDVRDLERTWRHERGSLQQCWGNPTSNPSVSVNDGLTPSASRHLLLPTAVQQLVFGTSRVGFSTLAKESQKFALIHVISLDSSGRTIAKS